MFSCKNAEVKIVDLYSHWLLLQTQQGFVLLEGKQSGIKQAPSAQYLTTYQNQEYAAVCCAHLRPMRSTSINPVGLCFHTSPLAGSRPVQGKGMQHLKTASRPSWNSSLMPQPARKNGRVVGVN